MIECELPTSIDGIKERLYDNRNLASFIWHSTREAMAFIDKSGMIKCANAAFSTVLGYTIGELEGKHIREITADSDDADADIMSFNELMTGKIPSYAMYKVYRAKNERRIPAKLRVVRYPSLVDGGVMVIGQFLPVDVTDLAVMPADQEKKLIQMLVGRWILSNWKSVLLLFGAIGGVTNIDRIVSILASSFGG